MSDGPNATDPVAPSTEPTPEVPVEDLDPAATEVVAPKAEDLGPVSAAKIPEPKVTKEPYDPSKTHEWIRGALALASFSLFTIFVLLITLAVICHWQEWANLKDLSTSVLPVVVSVVGTTTGFYFGTKSQK